MRFFYVVFFTVLIGLTKPGISHAQELLQEVLAVKPVLKKVSDTTSLSPIIGPAFVGLIMYIRFKRLILRLTNGFNQYF